MQFSEQGIQVDIARLELDLLVQCCLHHETMQSPHVQAGACVCCTRQQCDSISFIGQPFSFSSALAFSGFTSGKLPPTSAQRKSTTHVFFLCPSYSGRSMMSLPLDPEL